MHHNKQINAFTFRHTTKYVTPLSSSLTGDIFLYMVVSLGSIQLVILGSIQVVTLYTCHTDLVVILSLAVDRFIVLHFIKPQFLVWISAILNNIAKLTIQNLFIHNFVQKLSLFAFYENLNNIFFLPK